jgi:hypothetical protein
MTTFDDRRYDRIVGAHTQINHTIASWMILHYKHTSQELGSQSEDHKKKEKKNSTVLLG